MISRCSSCCNHYENHESLAESCDLLYELRYQSTSLDILEVEKADSWTETVMGYQHYTSSGGGNDFKSPNRILNSLSKVLDSERS